MDMYLADATRLAVLISARKNELQTVRIGE
jgi:hypothetical protein